MDTNSNHVYQLIFGSPLISEKEVLPVRIYGGLKQC